MSKRAPDPFARLVRLIQQYAAASVAESWKGGGDPDDIPVLEMRLRLTRAEVNAELARLRRAFDVVTDE